MAEAITGAELVARALRTLGIDTVFGLTGYPITAIGEAAINLGIRFLGFRNEVRTQVLKLGWNHSLTSAFL